MLTLEFTTREEFKDRFLNPSLDIIVAIVESIQEAHEAGSSSAKAYEVKLEEEAVVLYVTLPKVMWDSSLEAMHNHLTVLYEERESNELGNLLIDTYLLRKEIKQCQTGEVTTEE